MLDLSSDHSEHSSGIYGTIDEAFLDKLACLLTQSAAGSRHYVGATVAGSLPPCAAGYCKVPSLGATWHCHHIPAPL